MSTDPTPIADAIASFVRKPKGTLLSESELKKVLKAKFTKKEYKLFFFLIESKTKEEICEELRIDTTRYAHLYDTIVKKLNKESVKQLLYTENPYKA